MSETESGIANYSIDSGQSTFTVQAFATGLLSGLGHNPTIAIRDFAGEIRFVPKTFADAAFRLEIKTNSLEVIDDVKENDRREIEDVMHNQVLETSAYPQIVFQSTNVAATRIIEGRYKMRIIGDADIHGVSRNGIWIQAQVTIDGESLRAKGDFLLKQSDFKIKPVSVAAGALKLKDELKFVFDIAAHKQQVSE
jgi:polyisoprenoid-binding protein YceI